MRHLRLYQAIRLIVKSGSIRKASESLKISPSALNRSILSFEQELGVDIFERLPSGVRLSVPGELLYYHMEDHLTRMGNFADFLGELRSDSVGLLRVSVSSDLAFGLAPLVIARFRADFPGIEIELSLSETPAPLLARDADLALVTHPQTEPGLDVALSQKAEIVGRVGADHPCAGGELGLADIAGHALILPQPGTGVRSAIDLALRQHRVKPAACHTLPGPVHTLRTGVVPDLRFALGLAGTADLPLGSAPVGLRAMRLAPVQITVLRRGEGALPRAAERFVTVLQRHLDGLPPAANRP